MMMKYISKIQAGLRGYNRIDTKRATAKVIDGSYNSVYKGRSMNFDELREYVPGDNLKDMDWKASARSGRLLVKQYIAEKKHDIMLVFDSCKRMLADTNDGIEKREVAIMSAGTVGYMVNHQGDYVGAVFGDAKGVRYYPFKSDLINLEIILQQYHKAVTMENEMSLNNSLEYIIRNFRQRMIIAIVTDTDGVCRIDDMTLRRLLVRHDIILINVGDADISGGGLYDVEDGRYMPEFFTRSRRLTKQIEAQRQAQRMMCDEKMRRNGIAYSVFQNTDNMERQISELLNKHRSVKR